MESKKMNMNIYKRKMTITGLLSEYKAKGTRRLNALDRTQQQPQSYLDIRNLWNASSIGQEKQYEAIKTSGLLDPQRRITFVKFNYRHCEQKNMHYGKIYKKLVENPAILTQRKLKQRKINKNSKKLEQILQNKQNLTSNLSVDWLSEFHERQDKKTPFKKDKMIVAGSMNSVDLWGQRQLKQSLGSLPCMRDRPKLLKMYSMKKNNLLESRVKTQQ